MSKSLTTLFHYVKHYILFPELRKYISFILAHYSLRNCFSSVILTTCILTAPDLLGEAPASLQTPFFLETSLSIMSFLGRTFCLGLFLCLPLEVGCQHKIYNTNGEVLKYTWFTGPSLKGNARLCRQSPQVSLYYLSCANLTSMVKFYKKSHHLNYLE